MMLRDITTQCADSGYLQVSVNPAGRWHANISLSVVRCPNFNEKFIFRNLFLIFFWGGGFL
jgi:hypothetical protein